MPRRAAQVNQADVQRVIRACQRENYPVRITLQPHGPVVFETADESKQATEGEAADLAEDL
jgi:hypothetical protein